MTTLRTPGRDCTDVGSRFRIPMPAGRTTVCMTGEHDAATAVALAARLQKATVGCDADVEVDLSRVTFMDASIIRVLVNSNDELASRSRALSVRDPSACALRLLQICGLAGMIDSNGR